MNRVLFFLSTIVFSFIINPVDAQTKNSNVSDSIPFDLRVYENAMLIGDYDVARTALLYLITSNPEHIPFLDSLTRLYYVTGMYGQALISSEIYLKKDEHNESILEISAACYSVLGDSKKALSTYEILFQKNKSMKYLYQIAVIQYQMKRLGECEQSVSQIIQSKEGMTEKISINMAGQMQEVPISAAAYNLSGVMNKELGQNEKAQSDFKQALKIFPEYFLAQNNLDDLMNPTEFEDEPVQEEKSKRKK